ncbi:MAG: hypothetical protein AAF152_15770 [Cyanobacteria bacterium P01_A01_bin.114]
MIDEHPTPAKQVSRLTELAPLDEQLYAGVTALQENSIKLFQWQQDTFQPVADWPAG